VLRILHRAFNRTPLLLSGRPLRQQERRESRSRENQAHCLSFALPSAEAMAIANTTSPTTRAIAP